MLLYTRTHLFVPQGLLFSPHSSSSRALHTHAAFVVLRAHCCNYPSHGQVHSSCAAARTAALPSCSMTRLGASASLSRTSWGTRKSPSPRTTRSTTRCVTSRAFACHFVFTWRRMYLWSRGNASPWLLQALTTLLASLATPVALPRRLRHLLA
jgi:hypothetical protein